ncbi:glycerophosphodiester phosphodiesterase [Paenibacillus sp. SYP-B3998]|uniref:Glycerophosphodiester phosphodiesterase n=1 Tax=Paenibacillus sp. SYP-B3998 TaxID=2678564 RepID=A0A6G4A5V3_9BACL|nr:glycerophosphodiester phosphodiesterase family protein [Paenibacillus sp. SYP-B3998]NEW09752.1 glycerophosphodiester phosphodiesterase [Paenibacillus sp. SYP-B3998]
MNWNSTDSTTPWVFAHRGSSAEAPENTMAAFLLAVEQKCDVIELDIHLTRDDQVIVCHDETLGRTTNGSGRIGELTLEEIKRVDAGSWFGQAFAGETVPLLEEVLKQVPKSIGLNIELKQTYDGRIVDPVINLLREYEQSQSVLFSSYDHKLLYQMKEKAPESRVSLVYDAKPVNPLRLIEDFGLDVFSVSLHDCMVDAEDVATIRRSGRHVIVWTVNEELAMRQMLDCGVSGIITDYPDALRRLIRI